MNPTARVWPGVARSRVIHRLFEFGILIKGIDGALQLGAGLLLLFLSPVTIDRVVFFVVRGELLEDPTDLFVSLLLHALRDIVQSQTLASAFLLIHGAVKLLLVGGLAANKLWSYPAAIFVFALFTAYQSYEFVHRTSVFMGAITVLDVAVVALIAAEYAERLKAGAYRKPNLA
jgi:uncharacterized membrane protein